MVQATLASMRHYCPKVPICLVADGDFDVSDLETEYGLIVLRVSDLPSREMRALVGGNPRAKLAAMWEGPFEFYVWLDADAIVWGDFTPQIRSDVDFQIFWKEVPQPGSEHEQQSKQRPSDGFKHYYFDPARLKSFDPDFDWFGRVYFSDGAFGCRRNAIPFEKWAVAYSWSAKENNPWPPKRFKSMPIMNYLVHSMAQRGELTIEVSNLQHVWAHHGKEELKRDCIGSGWHFPKAIQRPRVAHFCNNKPFIFERKSYSRPFTIARLEHQRRHRGELGAWAKLLQEEWLVLLTKLRRRLAKRR